LRNKNLEGVSQEGHPIAVPPHFSRQGVGQEGGGGVLGVELGGAGAGPAATFTISIGQEQNVCFLHEAELDVLDVAGGVAQETVVSHAESLERFQDFDLEVFGFPLPTRQSVKFRWVITCQTKDRLVGWWHCLRFLPGNV
jgi:hypothetical protein